MLPVCLSCVRRAVPPHPPLQALHKGGPRLSCSDVCQVCLQHLLQGLVSSDDLVSLRDELLAALEADEGQQEALMEAPSSFYVSKSWVGGFKRRGTASSSRLEPPTAGAHLACWGPVCSAAMPCLRVFLNDQTSCCAGLFLL